MDDAEGAILVDFNSIKVRLEPPQYREKFTLMKFQFHKGTIRTGQAIENVAPDMISIP